MKRALYRFRTDLRLAPFAAAVAAVGSADENIPVFLLDEADVAREQQ